MNENEISQNSIIDISIKLVISQNHIHRNHFLISQNRFSDIT